MKNRIELTIEHKDPYMVQLTNGNGDTFTYNPQTQEGLDDFLNGAKILPRQDVVGRSEQLPCGDLMKHYFSLSKIGRCITCDRAKEKAR